MPGNGFAKPLKSMVVCYSREIIRSLKLNRSDTSSYVMNSPCVAMFRLRLSLKETRERSLLHPREHDHIGFPIGLFPAAVVAVEIVANAVFRLIAMLWSRCACCLRRLEAE